MTSGNFARISYQNDKVIGSYKGFNCTVTAIDPSASSTCSKSFFFICTKWFYL